MQQRALNNEFGWKKHLLLHSWRQNKITQHNKLKGLCNSLIHGRTQHKKSVWRCRGEKQSGPAVVSLSHSLYRCRHAEWVMHLCTQRSVGNQRLQRTVHGSTAFFTDSINSGILSFDTNSTVFIMLLFFYCIFYYHCLFVLFLVYLLFLVLYSFYWCYFLLSTCCCNVNFPTVGLIREYYLLLSCGKISDLQLTKWNPTTTLDYAVGVGTCQTSYWNFQMKIISSNVTTDVWSCSFCFYSSLAITLHF